MRRSKRCPVSEPLLWGGGALALAAAVAIPLASIKVEGMFWLSRAATTNQKVKSLDGVQERRGSVRREIVLVNYEAICPDIRPRRSLRSTASATRLGLQ